MLSERLALAVVMACALGAAACGDEPSAQPSPSAGGGGSGGAPAAGTGSVPAAVSGGGGQANATGGGSAGGAATPPPAECANYKEASAWSLTVQIKNERQQVLYIGQANGECETSRPFEVRDGGRSLLPALEKCQTSCEQLMQAAPVSCPKACTAPSTIALQPGETLKVPWDGRFAVPQTLPSACASPAAQGTTSCVQADHIESDVFTFAAQAGTVRQCLAGEGSCTCTPNQNGGCTAAGSTMGGTVITTELLVNLDPRETSPSGEPPYIGLVFRD